MKHERRNRIWIIKQSVPRLCYIPLIQQEYFGADIRINLEVDPQKMVEYKSTFNCLFISLFIYLFTLFKT
jgi:hypothetical protein